jgi:hypothetical protein
MWLVFVIEGQRPDQVLSGVDIRCDNRPYEARCLMFTEGFEVLRLTYLRYAGQSNSLDILLDDCANFRTPTIRR